jgi:hypothetical protein
MPVMKFLAALALFAICASARADLTIVQDVQGAVGASGQMTVNVKGDKARIETSPKMTMIIDSKNGDMINMMNEQKKFMRISGDAMRALSGKPQGSASPAPKLTPTQNHEKINGYDTTEYVFETPQYKASYWIATAYPDSAAIMADMQRLSNQTLGPNSVGTPNYHDFPGIPLRTQLKIGTAQVVSTVKSISRDSLPDSLFAPPADFQEIKMGDMAKMLGGKISAPKPAASPAKP